MIGFLKSRTLKNAAAREAASASAAAHLAEPSSRERRTRVNEATATIETAAPDPALDPDAAEADGKERRARAKEEAVKIETALASESVATPERYEIREYSDGWSVYDNQTVAPAKVYEYRLTKMNRSRAESLVAVLNRGEVRRRGRNG